MFALRSSVSITFPSKSFDILKTWTTFDAFREGLLGMNTNPYAVTVSTAEESDAGLDEDPQSVRRRYLAHEIAVQSVGLLYFFIGDIGFSKEYQKTILATQEVKNRTFILPWILILLVIGYFLGWIGLALLLRF